MKWELLNSLDLNGRRFSASKDSLKSLLFVFTCLVHCLQLLWLIQFHHFGAAWKWGKSCFNCNCFDLSASHKHMFSSRWALRNLHEWHDMKLLTICFWFRMRDFDFLRYFRKTIFCSFVSVSCSMQVCSQSIGEREPLKFASIDNRRRIKSLKHNRSINQKSWA